MKYPKIPSLGSIGTDQIFNGEYIIQEKFDGSQFSWMSEEVENDFCDGYFALKLRAFSKNKELNIVENKEKLFKNAINHLGKQWNILDVDNCEASKNLIFFGEAFQAPRHNKIKYERVPVNNIMLFDIFDKEKGEFITTKETLKHWASVWDIEWVRYWDQTEMAGLVKDNLLDKIFGEESILGGARIEGVVIKNYGQSNSKTGAEPLMVKHVSPEFKEVKPRPVGSRSTNLKEFIESFRTEARWDKAIQRFKEGFDFPLEDRNIGQLVRDIHTDLIIEEEDNIKKALWEMYKKDILSTSVRGFAEYFKERLRDE